MPPIKQLLSTMRAAVGLAVVGKSNAVWQRLWGRGDNADSDTAPATLDNPMYSAWVFRAVQHICGPVTAAPLQFKSKDGQPVSDRDQELFWAQPGVSGAGALTLEEFIETTISWMLLNGQALWILDDSWLDRRARKSPIFIARPDRVVPFKQLDTLLGYNYIDAAGVTHHLLPEQIVRPRFINPWYAERGMSPWDAAAVAAKSDYAAGLFAKNLSENNGDRGAYVIAKDGVVTEEQRAQIETILRQKREMNRRGVYKTAFLTGNITVEDPKVQSVDAAFVAQRMENRHEVFIALGVPASMADVQASYSAGSASDRYRLLEESCIPIANKIAACIDRIEFLRVPGAVGRASFYFDNHPVMQEVRMERAKTADTMINRGMPVKTANEWLSLGIPEYNGWATGYLPMNMVPVTGEIPDETQENDTTKPAKPDGTAASEKISNATDTLTRLFQAQTRTAPETKALTDWQKHMRSRGPAEKLVLTQYQKWAAEARAATLKKIEMSLQIEGIRQRGVLDLIFDLSSFTLRLINLIKQPLVTALGMAVEQFNIEAGVTNDPWKMEDPAVMAYLDERKPMIQGMAETVWTEVKNTIQEGITNGESNAKLADRVREAFTGISKERAKVIANTEVSVAYGVARQQAMAKNGIEWKQWLTAEDEKVRAEHVRADGQKVPVDQTFEVGGEHLEHPGDPKGSPGNVINCRCVAIPVRKPKE